MLVVTAAFCTAVVDIAVGAGAGVIADVVAGDSAVSIVVAPSATPATRHETTRPPLSLVKPRRDLFFC